MRRTVETNEQIFFDAIRSELANREIESRECFVFVHGYNVTFEAAALRTAQITYDLRTVGGYHGVPLLFSWPSAGNQLAYSWDRTEIAHSKDPLKEFLLDVTGRSGAASVNVLAHSMGADAVARAIADIDGDETVFNQVILAAPDIDAYVFERELLPKIAKKAVRTTVYCSSNDLALHASYCFNNAHRVGDSSRGLIVLKDMDTVDASQVRTDLLGHSYYGDCLELAADIGVLLRTNTAPDAQERHLLRRQLHNLAYWVFGKP